MTEDKARMDVINKDVTDKFEHSSSAIQLERPRTGLSLVLMSAWLKERGCVYKQHGAVSGWK